MILCSGCPLALRAAQACHAKKYWSMIKLLSYTGIIAGNFQQLLEVVPGGIKCISQVPVGEKRNVNLGCSDGLGHAVAIGMLEL